MVLSRPASRSKHTEYMTVTGFFLQDESSTPSLTFDYTSVNFGLINRTYDTDVESDPDGKKTQWQRFDHQVRHMNTESGANVQYKVLYLLWRNAMHNQTKAYSRYRADTERVCIT
ncbi:hypothetical protein MMC28_004636 [Mycoblastus sanguinarius]|nr:hypothetical protein [Mycoblastus sanguinarius]